MTAPVTVYHLRRARSRPFTIPMENLELLVDRRWLNELCSIGVMSQSTIPVCYTCEDTDRALSSDMPPDKIREGKVYGKTAIPWGRYQVKMLFSPHFQKLMPHIIDVPGFTDIMIHKGNGPQDTDGCVLVGKDMTLSGVYNCEEAFESVMALITETLNGGAEVWVTIRKDESPQV